MESKSELYARLNRVIAQKDRLANALCNVLNVIRDGKHNGLFEAGFRPKKGKTKCKRGIEFGHVKYGYCPHIGEDCCIDCPFTFSMYCLLEEEKNSQEVLRECDAAMIPFSPFVEIPIYMPEKYRYTVTTEWFVRRMIRFLLSSNVVYEKDISKRKAIGETYKRLVGFGCEAIGFREGWRQLQSLEQIRQDRLAKGLSDKEILKEIMKNKARFKEMGRLICAAERTCKRSYDIDMEKAIRKNRSRALRWIVLEAVMLIMEYDFGHDYPGADNGIYSDVFRFIGRLCLAAVGLKDDDRFGILEFVNAKDTKDSFKAVGAK